MPPFADHLKTWQERYLTAAERCGKQGVAVYSGHLKYRFGDDRDYPFMANPHYVVAAPHAVAPQCWVIFTGSDKPRLIYFQPEDYWHVVPETPQGQWVDAYDICVVATEEQAQAALPDDRANLVFIGEESQLAAELGFVAINPATAITCLEYARGVKTPYEIELMAEANRVGARAHRAAETAFRDGGSEFDIQIAYMSAAGQSGATLPYENIVALNEHAAVLHYHGLDRHPPTPLRSFLIDAGASCHGYASDITRTYSFQDGEFAEMIATMDARQRQLTALVQAGTDYRELHVMAHQQVAEVLVAFDLVEGSAEAAVEEGITRAFFPHGLGHLIGSQVHDAAGHAAGPDGGCIDPPQGHPHLRLTRTLEANMVTTIEPGLYFIGLLLEPLRASAQGKRVDWDRVEAFRPYGGIRIEDDVVALEGRSRNLSREAFVETAG